ncbi:unnamed protein product [Gordionus sp. m RMFG-2023]|uniref:tigger transposable element-derived protein 4-like n=1 Tax=Gordionus sp. m RMFG-2023 TaxID=3053472 RepID=UPI0030E4080D
MPTMTKTKKYHHHQLTFCEKLEVIKYLQNHSQRACARKFLIGHGTVHNIKKNKDDIIKGFEEGILPSHRKRKYKSSENEQINDYTWKFYEKAKSQDIVISGPVLKNAALKFAQQLGQAKFQASNGWLDSFKNRHNISFSNSTIKEVSPIDLKETNEFKSNMHELIKCYTAQDIFNADDTLLYFKTHPKDIPVNDIQAANKFIEKFCVILAISMEGNILKPLVVGKTCPQFDISQLPVLWRTNNKTSMLSRIYEEWLNYCNERFKEENRNVLMFLTKKPSNLNTDFSNIKIIFIPSKKTFIQPLNKGVFQNFRLIYNNLTKKLIEKEKSDTYSKNDYLLDAIQCISEAVRSINPETINECFVKSGIIHENYPAKKDIVANEDTTTNSINNNLTLTPTESKLFLQYFENFNKTLNTAQQSIKDENNVINLIQKSNDSTNINSNGIDGEENGFSSNSQNYVITFKEANEMTKRLKKFIIEKEPKALNEILTIEDMIIDAQLRQSKNEPVQLKMEPDQLKKDQNQNEI